MIFSFEEIGRALGHPVRGDGSVSGVSTDTRALIKGDLFIALPGERFNGNEYVTEALAKGAALAICSDPSLLGEKTVVVGDTLAALRNIASLHRDRFELRLCALTGSVGKTTTRGMVAEVFSSAYRTLSTKNNLNNEIGVAKTLLELDGTYEAAVIEMGMNHFGENERMSLCVKPTLAVITNVGVAHIENLGSREGILKAKLEIAAGLMMNAPLIVNGDNDLLGAYTDTDRPVVRFGIDNTACDVLAKDIKETSDGSYYTVCAYGDSARGFVPNAGRHNVYNAVCAAAAGLCADIPLEKSVEAIARFQVEGRRQKLVRRNGILFIEDCYNANPDSVAAALSTLKGFDCKRRIAVLGDMLELGDYAEEGHRRCGALAAKSADILFTYGALSETTAREAKAGGCPVVEDFPDKPALARRLAEILKEGDAALFKASRSMRFEDIIEETYHILFGRKDDGI